MPARSRRLRLAVGWLLTVLLAAYALSDWGDDDSEAPPAATGEADDDGELRITMLSDAEVSPGDAVVIRFDNADAAIPIAARVAGEQAQILVRRTHSVVVRVPSGTRTGRAPVRLLQGHRKSKPWDLLVRGPRHRRGLARVIGGLALFAYGFGVLAAGFRGLAGRKIRQRLARATERPTGAVGIGALLGAATQLTTSASAITAGLLEARMLAIGSAVGVLVGVQLGASLVGALLPIGFARESLEIIAIGVVWTLLAGNRRGAAIGQAVLGLGLVLYGLRLLQTGLDPMLSDPQLLPYVGYLRADGTGPILCALAGVVLGAALQGPGPVYGLVLGLAQVSGALPLASLLAILAGTNLGAAIGMALVCSPSNRPARALIRPQLAFGLTATVFTLASAPLWIALARVVVPGDPNAPDYGKTIMLPHLSGHLAVAFAASQLVVTGLWTALAVSPLAAWAVRRRAAPAAAGEDALPIYAELRAAFVRHRRALDASLEVSTTGERGGTDDELGLTEARRSLEAQFAGLAAAAPTPGIERLRRAAVGVLQLQRAVEQVVHVTELGVERGLALTAVEQTRLTGLHRLAVTSLDALIESIDHEHAVDVEAARGREIEMNLLEAETRQAPSAPSGRRRNESAAIRLGLAELVDAYEHVGNHLFRVAKSLGEADDDLT